MLQLIRKIVKYPYLVYLMRCLLGFLIGYGLMLSFPQYDFFWTMISIVMVISPDETDARRMTIERVKSNFIGSLSCLIVYFLPVLTVYKVLIAIVLTVLICKHFKMMEVARSAIVAVLIILVETHPHIGLSPVNRFLAVALGCIIGLLITLITSYFKNKVKQKIAE
ncbi:Fusaric acid resistance protein-like [Flexibacter flexilis DSM 6793]|uniref:Fusaric acid resistance protein-like n=1 Tax=Flexibacter flexilis DSM 6793 TaxID=927664 RepID=A0A1I1MEN5_9BACT|nr:FUSC family protein [Flexibacter flexilis]SFC83884.1 Fusaric acid resistance protein-like [Flexibacter flexilis DSM 6793]